MTEACFIPLEKITGYLLNLESQTGAGKAKFFTEAGFSLEDVDTFIVALEAHFKGRTTCRDYESPHGKRRDINGPLHAPNGDRQVTTAWIYRDVEASWQFVTAVPRPALKHKAGLILE